MANVARDALWPSDPNILVRAAFLHVGQGESTIVLVANGAGEYLSLVIDSNLDEEREGVDVPRLVEDLLEGSHLHAFVNTHPHKDHLHGVLELSEAVEIDNVMHSGHKPGKEHDDAFQALKDVIKKVKDCGGAEVILQGSKTATPIGEAECHVLAPAAYVSDDIEGEKPEARYRRIHEQCAVLKFGKDSSWIMITGDADRDAWEKHITEYHKENVGASVLSAPHHGSRTFFKNDENDDPNVAALEAIAPDYVVISAPRVEESPHGHPHEEAVELYESQVGADAILHTGDKRYCFICDIYRDGGYHVQDDKGELVSEYKLGGGGDNGDKSKAYAIPAVVGTKVDQRPMGQD